MKTIAIISQKGGAGKTTIALHLAVAAELAGKPTAVIDLDPQASASRWGDSRERETPAIVSAVASRLPKVLEAAREANAKLAIIDTAPHSESAALAAARAADLVVIPCRPAILDLRALSNTVDLVKLAQAKALIVLNTVPPRGSQADEAAAALSVYEMPISPIRLGQRNAFRHSLTAGQTAQEYEPHSKAAHEIQQLYQYLCKQVNM